MCAHTFKFLLFKTLIFCFFKTLQVRHAVSNPALSYYHSNSPFQTLLRPRRVRPPPRHHQEVKILHQEMAKSLRQTPVNEHKKRLWFNAFEND